MWLLNMNATILLCYVFVSLVEIVQSFYIIRNPSYTSLIPIKISRRLVPLNIIKDGKERSSRSAASSSPKRSASISQSYGIRQSKVARSLRDELSDIINEADIKAVVYPDDDLLRGTTIADVEVSGDLSTAKVMISVMGNSVAKRQVFVWLCENVGQVRYSLAKRLRHMKRIPEIYFKLIDTRETADLMETMDEIALALPAEADEDFEFSEGDEDE